MRKFVEKYSIMLALCMIALFGVFLCSGEVIVAAVPFVYDEAGLLSENERETLIEQVDALREETGWDVFAVTTANAGGKSSMDYADDFYDAQTPEDSDGVLVLIDMDNREIYISTCGEASRYLEDARIDAILDDAFYYASREDYAGCLSSMLDGVAYYYKKGIHESQYNYDVETGVVSEYRTITTTEAAIAAVLAVGAGLSIYFMVINSYSLKGSTRNDGYAYTRYGTLDLTDTEDRFVHQTLTHHVIQSNNSSGGSRGGGHRSSIHRSSSGRSHGGGGRSF